MSGGAFTTLGAPPRPPPPPPPPAPRPPAAARCSGCRRGFARRRYGTGVRRRSRLSRRRCSRRGAAPGCSRLNALLRSVAQVVAAHGAILRFAVGDGPIGGVLARIEAVAARDGIPVLVHRPSIGAKRARTAPCIVILQSAADIIRAAHVRRNLIELPDGDIVVIEKRHAAIVARIEAAIVADPNDARIVGIDIDAVIIGVRTGEAGPRLAAIVRNAGWIAAGEDLLIVLGIDANLAEIHWPIVAAIHLFPRLAAVFGTEHAVAIGIRLDRRGAASTTTASAAAETAARAGNHGAAVSGLSATPTAPPRPPPAAAPAAGAAPASAGLSAAPSPPPAAANPPRPREGPPSAAVPPPVPAPAPASTCA